jgi:hypothetical protein
LLINFYQDKDNPYFWGSSDMFDKDITKNKLVPWDSERGKEILKEQRKKPDKTLQSAIKEAQKGGDLCGMLITVSALSLRDTDVDPCKIPEFEVVYEEVEWLSVQCRKCWEWRMAKVIAEDLEGRHEWQCSHGYVEEGKGEKSRR